MKYKKIFLPVLFVSALFSCNKLVEIKETDAIAGEVALQTVANNEQAIIGGYAGLGIEMSILLNATFSDEVKTAEFYNAATTHEWQYSSTDIGLRDNFTAINPYYRIIDRANRVLQAVGNAQPLRAGDDVLKSRLRGEALFLRAFCHFELYRYYSGDTDPNALAMAYIEAPGLDPQQRIAVGPYFQKLKADMAAAKGLVPNNLTDVGRATQLAVSGLQARVALYLKEWADAITYSTEYINGLPLASRADFPGIWTDANNSEIAFELKRTSAIGGRIGSLFRGTSATSGGVINIGTVSWAPSEKIWSSYDQTNDIRFSSYLKSEPLLTAANRQPRLIKKYEGTGYATAAENVADAKVFRTGEMYLIRAEARAESNNLTGAALDLNALRAARISGYTTEVFATQTSLIDAIIQERFKELAFEGHRFWDLRRRGLPVTRLSVDAPSAVGTTLPAGNFRFRLPIPNAEVQANPAIQQNPGYTN